MIDNLFNKHKVKKVFNNRKKVSAKWADNYGFVNNTPPKGYERLKQKVVFNQKNGNGNPSGRCRANGKNTPNCC